MQGQYGWVRGCHTQPVQCLFFFQRVQQHSRLRHASAAWNTAQWTPNSAAKQRCAHGTERDVH